LYTHFQRDRDALDAYQKLSVLRPLQEEEAVSAAAICLTSRDVAGAEKYFRQAIAANNKSTSAWKGLGLILASKQQWSNALEAFVNAGDCEHAKDAAGKTTDAPLALINRFKETCQ
jgi:hypothetical protein